jgi:hypothetical protein
MLPNYTPYKNLPPLAGLCSIEEATKPGLPLEECVRRLKRFHYCFKRLHEILTARLTSEPIYELKTAFAHHAYLCAEHVTALRQRISEMREPPLGLEDVPHPALEVFFDEILCAPTTEELIFAFQYAADLLYHALRYYHDITHPLTDAPSRRVVRFAMQEVNDMATWGTMVCACLVEPDSRRSQELDEWGWFLGEMLHRAGMLDGVHEESGEPIRRLYSSEPYTFDPVPQRDERFTDPWNQGVNAEAFLYSEQFAPRDKVLMMLFKRLREIDVPEMMASIIVQTKGKPWGYYAAMSRQLWDEARHAMMGEVGFVALGVDWTKARITWNWSYRLNTECSPLERHGVLFFIEQGLMPKTGKRYEFEVAGESGIPIAKTIQDFDWADEVLHSQIGREWYVKQFGSLQEALDFGDKAWSKILSNWTTVKEQGLTQHANWWPAIYEQACVSAGRAPDPAVIGYDETYEAKRADLRGVVGE